MGNEADKCVSGVTSFCVLLAKETMCRVRGADGQNVR